MNSDDELDEALKLRKLGHNSIKFFDNAHPGYAQYFALYQDMVDLYSVASDLVSQLEIRRAKNQVVQSEDVQDAYGEASQADVPMSRPASDRLMRPSLQARQTKTTDVNAAKRKKHFDGVKTFLSNFFD